MKVYAIIPAAGIGKRFSPKIKKQFYKIDGKSILEKTLSVFIKSKLFDKIIVVLSKQDLSHVSSFFSLSLEGRGTQGEGEHQTKLEVVPGGKTRAESVFLGFQKLNAKNKDIVLIHDAVRCFVSIDLIQSVIKATKKRGAVLPVVTPHDTVKVIKNNKVTSTLDRNNLGLAQTPQGFCYDVLQKSYKKTPNISSFTDEASLVEAAGFSVFTVEGEKKNIKITTREDLK